MSGETSDIVKALRARRDEDEAAAAADRIEELERRLSTRHRYNELEKARTELATAEAQRDHALANVDSLTVEVVSLRQKLAAAEARAERMQVLLRWRAAGAR